MKLNSSAGQGEARKMVKSKEGTGKGGGWGRAAEDASRKDLK